MQVEALLQIKQKEFSDFLLTMIKQDIALSTQATLEEVTPGFQYKKAILTYMQKKELVHVTIEELNDHAYQASFQSPQGKNYLSYTYEETNEGLLHVTYLEDYYAINTSTQLSHKVMAMLTNRKNKKRASTLLKQIEHRILEQRTNGNEEASVCI